MVAIYAVFEALILVVALSIDAFLASFSYGVEKIRIPLPSALMISTISAGVLGTALLLGKMTQTFLSPHAAALIGFVLLFIIGLVKLFDTTVKLWIRKSRQIFKNLSFNLFNLNFILTIYADPDMADADKGGVLSLGEAVSLGIALSFDSAAAGLGAGVASMSAGITVVFTLLITMGAVYLGAMLGNRIAKKFTIDFSWISGLLLIILAFAKLC